jgi:predicted DNA binding CopG/RHH family protein
VAEKLVVKPIRLTETTWNAYKTIAERKGLSTGTYIRMILVGNKDYQNELRKT